MPSLQMPRENARRKAGPGQQASRQGLGAKRLAQYSQRIEDLLRSLFGLLKAMPAESREKSLRQLFSQPQRLALERFVQRGGAADLAATVSHPANRGHKPSATQAPKKSGGTRRGGASRTLPNEKARDATDRLSRSLGLVQNLQRNGCYYRAQMQIGYLRLVSRSWRSPAPAEPVRQCLQALRELLSQDLHKLPDEFAQTFAEALPRVLAEHGLTCAGAGLRLYISFKPKCSSEPILSRPYDLAKEMELHRGLAAFAALGAAKSSLGRSAESWSRFRDVFAEAITEAKGTKKQLKRNIAIVDAAEHKSQAQERRRQIVCERMLHKEQARKQRQLERQRAKRQPEFTRPERAVRRLLRRWATLDAARCRMMERIASKAGATMRRDRTRDSSPEAA